MALTAALYVSLCYVFAPISYGAVQFRIAEVLLILPYYDKKYSIPLILGTFTANIFMFGLFDMIFGTLATALVCLAVVLQKNKYMIAPAAALINGVVIGLMLYYIFGVPYALWFCMLSVAIGEFVVVLAGVTVFSGIENISPKFIDMIKGEKNR